jgi:hypothetical protein
MTKLLLVILLGLTLAFMVRESRTMHSIDLRIGYIEGYLSVSCR